MGLICGLLGLVAGININPESTVNFIPDWGILGSWVSGLGALAAVWAMVWIHYQQREDALSQRLNEEMELLDIVQVSHEAGILTTLSLISRSSLRVVVKNIYIRDVLTGFRVRMPMRDAFTLESATGLRLPAVLEFRDVVHFDLDSSRVLETAVGLSKLEPGIWSELAIDVETSTGKIISVMTNDILLREFNNQRAIRLPLP